MGERGVGGREPPLSLFYARREPRGSVTQIGAARSCAGNPSPVTNCHLYAEVIPALKCRDAPPFEGEALGCRQGPRKLFFGCFERLYLGARLPIQIGHLLVFVCYQ